MLELFRYDPLEDVNGANSIRLITIVPGTWLEPIECMISHVTLQDSPPYEALSYCWGGTQPSKAILCERNQLAPRKAFAVTKSLNSALFRLRDPVEQRIIWIDALCIDQSNITERNQQVRLMKEIYSRASRVIVFLGDIDPGYVGRAGLHIIPELLKAKKLAERQNLAMTGLDHNLAHYKKNLKRMELPLINSEAYQNLARILKRPWFQRVWVIQEVALASEARVLFGDEEVGWEDLLEALKFCNRMGIDAINMDPLLLAPIGRLSQAQLASRNNLRQNLLHVLTYFRPSLATDPRDKVFALLGLAADVDRLEIIPDYNMTPLQLYKSVAMKILKTYQSLDILSITTATLAVNTRAGPSWVPDWSLSVGMCVPFALDHYDERFKPSFRASKDSRASPLFQEEENILVIEGYAMDEVSELAPVIRSENRVDPNQVMTYSDFAAKEAKAQALWAEWDRIAHIKSRKPGRNGESNHDVYWQTLVANCIPNGREATYKAYLVWRKSQRRTRLLFRFGKNNPKLLLLATALIQTLLHAFGVKEAGQFQKYMYPCLERRLARTRNDHLALLPALAKETDQIFLVKGSKVPLVLRREPESSTWKLVGDSYVHGIMYGEAFREEECKPIRVS